MNKENEPNKLAEIAGGYPLKFALPILFGFGNKQESISLNNGTVSLVDLGQGKFYITCAHVFESFLEKLNNMKDDERPLLQVGNLAIRDRPPIIDQSEELDLITIKFTDSDHQQMRHQYSTDAGSSFINTIETSAITKNNLIAFGGFPGEFRDRTDPHHVNFPGFSTSLAKIATVNDNEIVCQLDEINDPKTWEKISGLKDAINDPGGLSGGPAFIMKDTPILHWTFIGIIREGFIIEKTLFIYIRHINCINPDGTIIKS